MLPEQMHKLTHYRARNIWMLENVHGTIHTQIQVSEKQAMTLIKQGIDLFID